MPIFPLYNIQNVHVLFSVHALSITSMSVVYYLHVLSFARISLPLAYRCYLNALLAAFFTFTIRLYQRMKTAQVSLESHQHTPDSPPLTPQVSMFSRQFLELFVVEDSGHYMLYTFFFYNQPPQIG